MSGTNVNHIMEKMQLLRSTSCCLLSNTKRRMQATAAACQVLSTVSLSPINKIYCHSLLIFQESDFAQIRAVRLCLPLREKLSPDKMFYMGTVYDHVLFTPATITWYFRICLHVPCILIVQKCSWTIKVKLLSFFHSWKHDTLGISQGDLLE